jgi:antitoxin MazE
MFTHRNQLSFPMSITVAKWGNSAGVRIPSVILKSAGISIGDIVHAEVTAERAIIIRAVAPEPKKAKVDIRAMLAGITPENLPDVSLFETTPIGKEVW